MDAEETVRRARGGDARAREDLARAWWPAVYGVALSVLGRAPDAEDATQEAFLRAFAALPSLRDGARFGPWILAIARNAARDQQRRPAHHGLPADAASPGAAGPDGPADGALAAWRRLPEEERLVLWLRASEGLTFRQIAELLSTSKSAVDRTWRRALSRLSRETTRC
jgi:RNA polymerase sigma-70 factor (ECF subfamily)